jgi:hypothetical protein
MVALVSLFEDFHPYAFRAKRVTMQENNLKLARHLRGKTHGMKWSTTRGMVDVYFVWTKLSSSSRSIHFVRTLSWVKRISWGSRSRCDREEEADPYIISFQGDFRAVATVYYLVFRIQLKASQKVDPTRGWARTLTLLTTNTIMAIFGFSTDSDGDKRFVNGQVQHRTPFVFPSRNVGCFQLLHLALRESR